MHVLGALLTKNDDITGGLVATGVVGQLDRVLAGVTAFRIQDDQFGSLFALTRRGSLVGSDGLTLEDPRAVRRRLRPE